MAIGIPTDYLTDVVRVDLSALGCSRVIVLDGPDGAGGAPLRAGLARWGLQVLAPPEDQRGWIASLAEDAMQGMPPAELDRLRSLLADGMEHGVEAIVATDGRLAALVRSCELGVPVVGLDPLGSVTPVRNVIFDMGGVLLKWEPLKMARRVCEGDDDARLLARAVFGSAEWSWQDAGAVDAETVAWVAKRSVPARLHVAVDSLVHHWHDQREMIEGADALIRDLKAGGYGIYLLSNAGPSFDEYERDLPGRDCFDGVVVSFRERVVKPDARIYRTLLDRYGLVAGECLFVDDVEKNVVGARRVGMRGWHFDGNVGALGFLLGCHGLHD